MPTDDTHESKLLTPAACSTPMQALSGLFRTPARLNPPTPTSTAISRSRYKKRNRARTSSFSSSYPFTPPSRTIKTPKTPSLPAVILQTYSVSTDSIVLTALPSVPFCCHEDLLTMTRAQLEGVVRALNARLPRRMRIGPDEDEFWQNSDLSKSSGEYSDEDDDDEGLSRMSEAEMKKRIEELVGIRTVVGKNRIFRSGLGLGARVRGVPPAPKAVKTRNAAWRMYEQNPWEMEVDDDNQSDDDSSITIEDALMGSSPLASRSKFSLHSRGGVNTLSHLDILQEESEDSESKEDDSDDDEPRPPKKQRVLAHHLAKGFQVAQESRESRLIEDMDISGSPLLAGDEGPAGGVAENDEGMVTDTNTWGAKTSEEDTQAPLQRRRSARIKEITMKRMSSVGATKKTTLGVELGLKQSAPRSKTTSGQRSSTNPSPAGGSNLGTNLDAPREFTIRIPFTSTPPHQKPESSAWSAPRVLRSHSQRLQNSNQSTKKKALLGRSKSEKYPRASDLAFVTINRPRYRFRHRKSKGTSFAREGEEFDPSMSTSSVHVAYQTRRGVKTGTEHTTRTYDSEKENDDPNAMNRTYPRMGGLHTLPSVLCSFLSPRSRAPSMSTVASGNRGDSPARMTDREGDTDCEANDGNSERVSEALERMAVDSL